MKRGNRAIVLEFDARAAAFDHSAAVGNQQGLELLSREDTGGFVKHSH